MQRYTEDTIKFIQQIYEDRPSIEFAVVGISGGKDSAAVAALCVQAIGANRVLGVILPNKDMRDMEDAELVCSILKIKHITVDINVAYKHLSYEIHRRLRGLGSMLNRQGKINIAPRLRMASLYSIANSINGLVVNTTNLSERVVGYCTKWGDNVGDFAPIMHLTSQQVIQVGLDLGIPENIMKKIPDDGISGKTDEDNLGITYADIEKYIKGQGLELATLKKIEKIIKINAHKNRPIPSLLNTKLKQ